MTCCRQSKCNYCIHALLRCSHFPSCAFKSECENSTLGLLQRFIGLVLLELSELSSRAFSQSEIIFSRAVPVMMLLTSVSEKQRTNISTDCSGMEPKWGTKICILIRYIGIGALLLPGFGTQPQWRSNLQRLNCAYCFQYVSIYFFSSHNWFAKETCIIR